MKSLKDNFEGYQAFHHEITEGKISFKVKQVAHFGTIDQMDESLLGYSINMADIIADCLSIIEEASCVESDITYLMAQIENKKKQKIEIDYLMRQWGLE